MILIAAGSPFAALVLKQFVQAARPEAALGDARTPQETADALARPLEVAVIDAELLGRPDSDVVRDALARCLGTVILIDAAGKSGSPPRTLGSLQVLAPDQPGPPNFGAIRARLEAALAPQTCGSPVGGGAKDFRRRARPEAVLIGVSTGGPDILAEVLGAIGTPAIPVVVAQHMPADHTGAFAAHLDRAAPAAVSEHAGGPLPEGGVHILRGGQDYVLERRNGLRLRVVPGAPAGFKPSIDALFRSAAAAGIPVAAVVLTGMGRDGAEGAAALAAEGCPVLVQSPETCAVAGMTAAVIAACPTAMVLPPAAIAERLSWWTAAEPAPAAAGTRV